MRSDLSNQVIARIDEETRPLPRRTLDLENIHTPELGLLSPRRTEIAPRGSGREAALIAYSERLRNSYKTNEDGLRDGMLKLGEAFRDGQTINISCFCRAGEACHADVVKMAIEKVGNAMKVRETALQRASAIVPDQTSTHHNNPRTQRAINEILSIGRSELLLAKLEDTEGRNRSEHASHLNGHSQFVRDLYERGAMVRDGILISPKENSSLSPPLAITTNEYAVKRLSAIMNEIRARELAPQIVEYGTRIAGSYADRDSKIKVFNWIYGALEGRNEFLPTGERIPENQSKEEKVERTLKEIAGLAEEMSRLEPSDKLVLIDDLSERSAAERSDKNDYDQSLEKAYEEAIAREPEPQPVDSQEMTLGGQEFERIELGDTTLSRLASDMSKEELDRWIEVRLPALDEALENGTPANSILRVFQNNVYHAAKESPTDKEAAIDDLRFASAYIEHQLKQPESRLRHFNARYRGYAQMLERASSRGEVIDAASRIRLENAKIGFQWEKLTDPEKAKTAPPLSSKEMRFLFTETSPRHYTSEMTAAKLSYMNVGSDAKMKTEALMRGEISPGPEAEQLIDSLESRLGRRHLKDSVSATKHFLQSLKTSNAELRYKNAFDHSDIYRKLPAAERDFVYQKAVLQKEALESKLIDNDLHREKFVTESVQKTDITSFSEFREELKSEFLKLISKGSRLDQHELTERAASIIDASFARNGLSGKADHEAINVLSRELSDGIGKAASRLSTNHSQVGLPISERMLKNAVGRQNGTHDVYSR
ncbi:MAG: hypothetical protein KF762_07100 [Acidobacteria bacterium]|nr:hypothetical protein [Acidobacteriota bacterium]